jgi:hypothetical protein
MSKAIEYTPAEQKRTRDVMDDLIAAAILEEMGFASLREVPHEQKPALYAEHAKRMRAAGF